MRRLVKYSALCIMLMLLGSCQNQNDIDEHIQTNRANLSSAFPSALSGVWKSKDADWELTFTQEGKLSSAVMPLSKVKIRPNETTKVHGRKGEPGFYEIGDCPVEYQPDDKSIIIEININRVYAELGGGVLDGPYRYFINGQIRNDFKSWNAWVYSIPDLDVLMPDPNSDPNNPVYREIGKLDVDPNNLDSFGREVLFVRPEKE